MVVARVRGPLISRVNCPDRAPVVLTFNGVQIDAFEGDTILTAILVNRSAIRDFEFSNEQRAGFCFMGACQDCWVQVNGDRSVRACSTFVSAGMNVTSECANG
jgi:predicted molibdopterin-dependent oxidoreductase YjgC